MDALSLKPSFGSLSTLPRANLDPRCSLLLQVIEKSKGILFDNSYGEVKVASLQEGFEKCFQLSNNGRPFAAYDVIEEMPFKDSTIKDLVKDAFHIAYSTGIQGDGQNVLEAIQVILKADEPSKTEEKSKPDTRCSLLLQVIEKSKGILFDNSCGEVKVASLQEGFEKCFQLSNDGRPFAAYDVIEEMPFKDSRTTDLVKDAFYIAYSTESQKVLEGIQAIFLKFQKANELSKSEEKSEGSNLGFKKKRSVEDSVKRTIERAEQQRKKENTIGGVKEKFQVQEKNEITEIDFGSKKVRIVRYQGNLGNGKLFGAASCVGRRNSMEDTSTACEVEVLTQSGSTKFPFFGIFDGHGGDFASKYVEENIKTKLKEQIEACNKEGLTTEGIYHAFKNTFKELDAGFWKKYANSSGARHGTTAISASMIEGHLFIGNLGDSRAIIIKPDGTVIQASEDAKPEMLTYQKKISNLGSYISNGRVQGSLAVARAIGDYYPEEGYRKIVPAVPKMSYFSLCELKGAILVMASDGLFDVATSDNVGREALRLKNEGKKPFEIASMLTFAALKAGSGDNVTITVCNL